MIEDNLFEQWYHPLQDKLQKASIEVMAQTSCYFQELARDIISPDEADSIEENNCSRGENYLSNLSAVHAGYFLSSFLTVAHFNLNISEIDIQKEINKYQDQSLENFYETIIKTIGNFDEADTLNNGIGFSTAIMCAYYEQGEPLEYLDCAKVTLGTYDLYKNLKKSGQLSDEQEALTYLDSIIVIQQNIQDLLEEIKEDSNGEQTLEDQKSLHLFESTKQFGFNYFKQNDPEILLPVLSKNKLFDHSIVTAAYASALKVYGIV